MTTGLRTARSEANAAAAARAPIRTGEWTGQTAGMAPGFIQGNLAIVPAAQALDFARYCQRNPKPCPVIGISDTGDPMLRTLGDDIDVRTDLPRYNVYRDGALSEEVGDLKALWRDDLVAFVLGCSFSFEKAMVDDGIPLRHWESGRTVPMYRTAIATVPAGPFRGPTVVSMRPLTPAQAVRAVQVTARFPDTHGTPLHFGDPGQIGIADLARPDWGDPPDLRPGEIPVFWACGVTPQAAALEAKLPLVITHRPGCMLITDIPDNSARPTL